MHVLVVDDEPDIRRFMSHALIAQGMKVETAGDGPGALRQLRQQTFDMVLLDVLLPGTTGLELLPLAFKLCPGLRVMMISALNEPRTRVRCLELGAVDYLPKPFVLAELIARIRIHTATGNRNPPAQIEQRQTDRRVHSRRRLEATSHSAEQDGRFVRANGATLDVPNRKVHLGGQVVSLSERESLVLACLLRHSGDVCSRQDILSQVWGSSGAQNGNLVDVYVGRLRAKLPPDTITTVRNTGYVFNAA